MNFDNEKMQALERKDDKSQKQSIDKAIKPAVDLINSKKDYYTTSSCSGRIMLIEKPEKPKKYDSNWLFVSHEKAGFDDVKNALAKKSSNEVWLMQESAILHICCRSLDAAESLLGILRDSGFKRSGIISLHKRIIIETFWTGKIETVVAIGGKTIVDDYYLKILIETANRNMELNMEKINCLYKALEKL